MKALIFHRIQLAISADCYSYRYAFSIMASGDNYRLIIAMAGLVIVALISCSSFSFVIAPAKQTKTITSHSTARVFASSIIVHSFNTELTLIDFLRAHPRSLLKFPSYHLLKGTMEDFC